MPIDRCGFSSWRDRGKKSPRFGGTCGKTGEEPPERPDAVPAGGRARRGAGVCACVPGCTRVCVRVCEPTSHPYLIPRARVPGAAARRCPAGCPPAGAEAARLRLRRSLRLGHRCRCSASPGSAPKFLFPIFRPPLYNKSFLFTKTVVIRPRVNRM